MKEKKFRVGEYVQIREWRDMAKDFTMRSDGHIDVYLVFTTDMRKYCGKTLRIERALIGDRGRYKYKLDVGDMDDLDDIDDYTFSLDMFVEKLALDGLNKNQFQTSIISEFKDNLL